MKFRSCGEVQRHGEASCNYLELSGSFFGCGLILSPVCCELRRATSNQAVALQAISQLGPR